MNTNKFSFSRFASFFRWFANISMGKWIKILITITLGTFLFTIIVNPKQPLADNSIYEAIFIIGAGVIASMALSDINKPTIRQQFISIPANAAEKYYTILLMVTIRTVGLLLALCVADFFKTLIQYFQGGDFKMAIGVFDETIISMISYFGLVLMFWIFNFMSAITVRKYPILYGFCIGGVFTGTTIAVAIKKFQKSINVDADWIYNNGIFENPLISIVFGGTFLVLLLTIGVYGFNKIQLSSNYYQTFHKIA